jgi:two-component system nitrogen regulation sensor histidine kinase NtrY
MLQENGQPHVRFRRTIPSSPVTMEIDETMIGQALTNLIKNAGEAIDCYQEKAKLDSFVGEIQISVEHLETHLIIRICDNGTGLPEDRARLFEPYVTTREKGTGLGLPIVKKIIEEHGGTLALLDAEKFEGNDHFGAMAVISLPFVTTKRANKIDGPSGRGK